MTILKFHGVAAIKWDHNHRDSGDYEDQPCIGDTELIPAIEAAFKDGQPVTVAIGDERFTGDLDSWMGMCGWSEYTPADPAMLFLRNTDGPDEQRWTHDGKRGHDLIGVIDRLEGQVITMYVADEPIDLTPDVADDLGAPAVTTVKDELAGYSRDHLIEVAKLLNPDGLPPEIQEAQHAEVTREEPE